MAHGASEDVSGWWFLPGGCLFSIYPVPGLVLDIGCTMVSKRPWKWAFRRVACGEKREVA